MDKIVEAIENIRNAVANPSATSARDTKAAVAELADWLSMQSMSPSPLSAMESIVCKLAADFIAAYQENGDVKMSQFQILIEGADLLKRMGEPAAEPEAPPEPEPRAKLYVWQDTSRPDYQWRTRLFIDNMPVVADTPMNIRHSETREEAIARADVEPEVAIIDEVQPKPYLYILMRNDLASLNAGKAVAQGTHAANQMVKEAQSQLSATRDMVAEWEREANGFGTCVVLSCNEREMRAAVASAQEAGEHAAICHDPTYPLLDGRTLHLLPVDTCAYIFGYKARVGRHMTGFPLMP